MFDADTKAVGNLFRVHHELVATGENLFVGGLLVVGGGLVTVYAREAQEPGDCWLLSFAGSATGGRNELDSYTATVRKLSPNAKHLYGELRTTGKNGQHISDVVATFFQNADRTTRLEIAIAKH
ncbi:hypothetical protein [Burkholderia cenocepacia]|uniref:hypothetical protein n=1 Tax=Burkholderia cenocepacia TaxID=95486 RepID=UPI0022326EB1|nr:hypothetical protein [Burkholderia cenocepacia]MCW3677815.1 hypothetical protein [Burkholderia cenocepacia]